MKRISPKVIAPLTEGRPLPPQRTPEEIQQIWDDALIEAAGTGESAMIIFWRRIYQRAGLNSGSP